MTAYDEENYHHCVSCGIAPCDCGEYVDTSWCQGCSFCDEDKEEEGVNHDEAQPVE